MVKQFMTPSPAPPRYGLFRWSHVVLWAGVMVFILSLHVTELLDLSLEDMRQLPLNIFNLLADMIPPSVAPLQSASLAILQTFQMALLGTLFGVVVSLLLGVFAARNLTPHYGLYLLSRALIALFRTVPDLVWGIFFVILVGLGPLAGALTLWVDTVGFAGRFFAEAIEDVDPGPGEALAALGATRAGQSFSSVFPAVLPSFVNTTLFSFERAVQSSVILGLVGAGGIGKLLEEPMTWHNYAEASTIVLCIFVMLLGVERASAQIRRRAIGLSSHATI